MDILTLHFGPDEDPLGDLPVVSYGPYSGYGCQGDHTWVAVTVHELTGHVCQYCGAVQPEIIP